MTFAKYRARPLPIAIFASGFASLTMRGSAIMTTLFVFLLGVRERVALHAREDAAE